MAMSNKRRKILSPSRAPELVPSELVTEILLLLPVKSLTRFRAVCRDWAALLSSEEFVSLHTAKVEAGAALAPPRLLFLTPTAGYGSTSAYSCSLSGGHDTNHLFTLDEARVNFVDSTKASCRGL
ncbi:hypothetical protein E2562_033973 [Oryza meyeriana var. granulata]|nr:hypothetical protein E2562_033972 [Oryza meyeriana var. granulata]KAF0894097.1 hypothetical protein E2562_033973 [Oryza meyeriana var. granulata]